MIEAPTELVGKLVDASTRRFGTVTSRIDRTQADITRASAYRRIVSKIRNAARAGARPRT